MEDLGGILLGECPFCGRTVETDAVRTDGPACAAWTARSECAHCHFGCLFDVLTVQGADVQDMERTLRRLWREDADMIRHPTPCSRCGRPPAFERFGGWLRFGCLDCERWLSGDGTVMEFEHGWTLWNSRQPSEVEK